MKYIIIFLCLCSVTFGLDRKTVSKQINTTVIPAANINDYTLEEVLEFINKFNKQINYLTFFKKKELQPVQPLQPAQPQQMDPTTGLPLPANGLPPIPQFDPATGQPLFPNAPAVQPQTDASNIKIGNVIIRNISIRQMLDIICMHADHPIDYAITDYGILIYEVEREKRFLYTRRFILQRPYLFTTRR